MGKVPLKEVIKLIKELRKSGVIGKKRKRKQYNKKQKQVGVNAGIKQNNALTGYSNAPATNNVGSTINTLIASEQLKMLEKNNPQILPPNNNPLMILPPDNNNYYDEQFQEHNNLIGDLYYEGNRNFNLLGNAIGDLYQNYDKLLKNAQSQPGFNYADNNDVPTTGGSDMFIPQGNKQSIIDQNLHYNQTFYGDDYDPSVEDAVNQIYDQHVKNAKQMFKNSKKVLPVSDQIYNESETSPPDSLKYSSSDDNNVIVKSNPTTPKNESFISKIMNKLSPKQSSPKPDEVNAKQSPKQPYFENADINAKQSPKQSLPQPQPYFENAKQSPKFFIPTKAELEEIKKYEEKEDDEHVIKKNNNRNVKTKSEFDEDEYINPMKEINKILNAPKMTREDKVLNDRLNYLLDKGYTSRQADKHYDRIMKIVDDSGGKTPYYRARDKYLKELENKKK